MLDKRHNLSAYFIISIACFFISVGLCVLISPDFESQLTHRQLMQHLLITSAVMTVFLFNRRTIRTGILLGIIALWGEVIYFLVNDYQSFFSYIWWCLSGLPKDSSLSTPFNVMAIHIFVNVIICISIYIVAHIPYMSRLIVLMSAALICVGYAFALVRYDRIIILLIFAGVFSICATDKFELRKQFMGNKNFKAFGKRWIVPIMSMVLCVAIAASALLAFDNDKKLDIRNRFCSNIAADIQSYTNIYTKEQKDLTVSLFDLGLQSIDGEIWGDLPIGEHLPLATAKVNTPINMKVTTFDAFTGSDWKTSFQNCYRVNGPFSDRQQSYLYNNISDISSLPSSLRSILREQKIEITVNADSPFLPSVGQTKSFTEISKTKNPTLFNLSGQLFSFFGQKKGFTYSLDTLSFNTDGKINDRQFRELQELMSREDPVYTDDFVKRYTTSFVNFKNIDKQLIKDMDLATDNPFEAAYKICNYFSNENGFSYVKKGLEDSGENIVEDVLTKREGHCVHYSTAAIALLRYFNIPSRLAAGYRTVKVADNTYVADSYSPYTWVECYFPNLGWISFDPSPQNKVEAPSKNNSLTKNQDNNQSEQPQDSDADLKKNNVSPQSSQSYSWLWLLLILAYVVSRAFWAEKVYNIGVVRKRFKTTKRQLRYYRKDIERQMAVLSHKRRTGETLREHTFSVLDGLDEECKALMSGYLEICEKSLYGGIRPTDSDIEQIAKARLALEKTVKTKMKPIFYILKRKVFIPII